MHSGLDSVVGMIERYWDMLAAWMSSVVFADLLNPWVLCSIPVILLIERFWPADREQPLFSRGLANDAMWFLLEGVQVWVVVFYIAFLEKMYQTWCPWLTISIVASLPPWLHFIWGMLLSDFLGWLHHWARHKVPVFWSFHTVHHSQRELNVFTDQRYHIVEYFVARTISTIPMLMLGVGSPAIVAFNIFHRCYTKFYHGNIRTNLGPLRYLLVTPQSHRIHHSMEQRHFDKNFGVLFSFWDRLFGTLYKPAEEYPKTGLPDEQFPVDGGSRSVTPLRGVLVQMVYPFVCVFRSVVVFFRAMIGRE